MGRRPHWNDDLIEAVADVLMERDDLIYTTTYAVIAAVEDWHVGWLLSSHASQRAAIQRVRELHRPCSDPHLHDGGRCCLECSDYGRQGVVRMYPCDTLNALEGDSDE